ncbi:phage tail protein [Ideonella sp. DXS29W]|uniref:Phage tail protein n=1 Tax=Ideonella lacteola TaxID=2984193 RepID=A0ABU9C1B8_9BURK
MSVVAPGTAIAQALGLVDYPPSAFYFAVNVGMLATPFDTSFQEVSGLSQTMETEDLVEGGENRFVHKLPKGVRQGNLSLKRGVATITSPLMVWCKVVMENGLTLGITPLPVLVHLLNESGLPIRSWCLNNAYPVRWEIEAFNSTKNEVAIEQIDFAYQYCMRLL